ncbi:adenine phosphoribosyltransferase [Porphyrobacter sp. GA68]|uniref:adenine phosphoribosyltransferase n=1 Tax=Porphyrobacter sp. GA68 TaxID=2883480 RepID=UPI001D193CD8|nr:adenine phosphoribosyltransferase [Porphyrobacter sp. GA68]
MDAADLERFVRTIPDFPAPGILFRDISPLIADAAAFAATIKLLTGRVGAAGPDKIAGIEARGFIFGAAVAVAANCGFVPVRKAGKLPVPALSVDYALEYGQDRLELDPTMIVPGDRCVIVDDLLATGGTTLAAAQLLRAAGAEVTAAQFVIELTGLQGATALRAAGLEGSALLAFT